MSEVVHSRTMLVYKTRCFPMFSYDFFLCLHFCINRIEKTPLGSLFTVSSSPLNPSSLFSILSLKFRNRFRSCMKEFFSLSLFSSLPLPSSPQLPCPSTHALARNSHKWEFLSQVDSTQMELLPWCWDCWRRLTTPPQHSTAPEEDLLLWAQMTLTGYCAEGRTGSVPLENPDWHRQHFPPPNPSSESFLPHSGVKILVLLWDAVSLTTSQCQIAFPGIWATENGWMRWAK